MRQADALSTLNEVEDKAYWWLKEWGLSTIKEAIRTVLDRESSTESDRQRAYAISERITIGYYKARNQPPGMLAEEYIMKCKCNDPDMAVVEQDYIYKLEAIEKAASNMRTKQFSGESVETLRKALESYHTYILDPRFD